MARMLRMLWGFCLAGALLQGQQPAFRHFGLRDGLPQSQVTTLLEDHAGFIWLGTETGGVARMSASGIKPFGAAEGLKARLVYAMIEDRRGGIWIGSEEGISCIRGNAVTNFGPRDGLPAASTLALCLDGDGHLLAGSHAGLFRLQGRRFVQVPLPPPFQGQPIRFMARDKAGGIWLAGSRDLLGRWDGRTLRLFPLPPDGGHASIQDLQADPQGRIWVLLPNRLLRMDRGAWLPVPLPGLPASPKMLSLRFDAHGGGRLIALGGDGLLVVPRQGPPRRLTSADGLPRDSILVALRDSRNVLWVGSDGDGLAAQVVPGLWTLDQAPDIPGRNLAAVMAIARVGPHRVLLASSTGLYLVQRGQGIKGHWTRAQGLPSDELWCLLPDDRGGAWVGTDRGLVRWREGRVAPVGLAALARTTVLTLVRDQGRILAGTEQGLFLLDAEGRLLGHLSLPASLGTDEIDDVLRYEGHLLVGTPVGLWRVEGDRMLPTFQDAPFSATNVTCMAADAAGELWVGTLNGLYRLHQRRWITYGLQQGLGDDSINFIASLGPGTMVIGHNRGVDILSGHAIQHLTRAQGLISDETNHDGFMVDPEGRLWIGMIGGVSILDAPGTFRNPPLRPPTVLEVRWPGGVVGMPHRVVVPPAPGSLDFTFDTAEPVTPGLLRYQALLEGFDINWRTVPSRGPELHYRGPGAGTYRFRLRVQQDHGPWIEAEPITVVIRPTWYQTWWARGALGLAILGMVWGLVWVRSHRLALRAQALEGTVEARTMALARQNWALEQAHGQIKRSLESRLKLMNMVTHDLRSPLTSIMLSLDRLREVAPEGRALLDLMDREADRIETLLRNLLDRSRSEALLQGLSLAPTVAAAVTEGFEEVLRLKAEAKDLVLRLEVEPGTDRAFIRADLAALQQVMLNLFENALKFTPPGGQVGLRSGLDSPRQEWSLEVWDTGRGLEASQIQEILRPFRQNRSGDAAQGWGLGLSICQDILGAHHGRLEIRSEPGQGAAFRMVLPLMPGGPTA